MLSAKEYWDQTYRQKPYSKGKGPSSFLAQVLPRLRKGRALDIAMGEGQNAVYLAQKGWEVKGIDLSGVAVEHATTLARETGVNLDGKLADVDMFIFNLFEFDTIMMSYFKPPVSRLYSEIFRALKQGGTLFCESFLYEELQGSGPPDSSVDCYFQPNEVIRQFKGLRILYYNEGEIDGHHRIQFLAQKPLDKDAVKYGFDIASKDSASSGPSAQQKAAEALFKKK